MNKLLNVEVNKDEIILTYSDKTLKLDKDVMSIRYLKYELVDFIRENKIDTLQDFVDFIISSKSKLSNKNKFVERVFNKAKNGSYKSTEIKSFHYDGLDNDLSIIYGVNYDRKLFNYDCYHVNFSADDYINELVDFAYKNNYKDIMDMQKDGHLLVKSSKQEEFMDEIYIPAQDILYRKYKQDEERKNNRKILSMNYCRDTEGYYGYIVYADEEVYMKASELSDYINSNYTKEDYDYLEQIVNYYIVISEDDCVRVKYEDLINDEIFENIIDKTREIKANDLKEINYIKDEKNRMYVELVYDNYEETVNLDDAMKLVVSMDNKGLGEEIRKKIKFYLRNKDEEYNVSYQEFVKDNNEEEEIEEVENISLKEKLEEKFNIKINVKKIAACVLAGAVVLTGALVVKKLSNNKDKNEASTTTTTTTNKTTTKVDKKTNDEKEETKKNSVEVEKEEETKEESEVVDLNNNENINKTTTTTTVTNTTTNTTSENVNKTSSEENKDTEDKDNKDKDNKDKDKDKKDKDKKDKEEKEDKDKKDKEEIKENDINYEFINALINMQNAAKTTTTTSASTSTNTTSSTTTNTTSTTSNTSNVKEFETIIANDVEEILDGEYDVSLNNTSTTIDNNVNVNANTSATVDPAVQALIDQAIDNMINDYNNENNVKVFTR